MGTDEDSLHAVVIPLPAQGHITPAILLAKKLVGLGFRITFVNTTHNHELMMKLRSSKAVEPERGIEFVSVSDGLPDDHPRLQNWQEFSIAILSMGPAFEELFVSLLSRSNISCVIRDIRFTAVQASAAKLNIPVAGLAACPAIALQCALQVPKLLSLGMLPLPPPPRDCAPSLHPIAMTLGPAQSAAEAAARRAPLARVVPGASPTMCVEHMPTHFLTHELADHWSRNALVADCNCLLFNSFQALEGDVLDAMAEERHSSVLGVGPLALVDEVSIAGAGASLREEDPVVLPWLEGRDPGSVVFIAFGSEAEASAEQAQEFAHGLELSGHAFLWVIRSSSLSEFAHRTQDRGLLVPWAPQTAVLSHPAVGLFLTHCGWNSTVESITCGVPMLGWPRFADHTTDCHYITEVWRVGLSLEPQESAVGDATMVVPREEVDWKVRKMMDPEDPEAVEIRRNSRKLKEAARKAVAAGGSSHSALTTFVELVKSWNSKSMGSTECKGV